LAAFFHNFAVAEASSHPLGAFFFIFFAVVTSLNLFHFLLSNVSVHRRAACGA
jgi:hypothetical protein